MYIFTEVFSTVFEIYEGCRMQCALKNVELWIEDEVVN